MTVMLQVFICYFLETYRLWSKIQKLKCNENLQLHFLTGTKKAFSFSHIKYGLGRYSLPPGCMQQEESTFPRS